MKYIKTFIIRLLYLVGIIKSKIIKPGKSTYPPIGYVRHKREYPDSVFSKLFVHPDQLTDTDDFCASIHKTVKRLFTYKTDIEERWISHYNSVMSNIPFSDDCDGFGCTCAEILHRSGVRNVAIAFCFTETGGGHLVCIADKLMLDNRKPFVIPWDTAGYKFEKIMYLNNPGQWYLF